MNSMLNNGYDDKCYKCYTEKGEGKTQSRTFSSHQVNVTTPLIIDSVSKIVQLVQL